MILMRFRISLRRALALINLTPSMYYYRRKRDDKPALLFPIETDELNSIRHQIMAPKLSSIQNRSKDGG